MSQESSLGARVTIWRPFSPDKALTYHRGAAENVSVVGPDMVFQQEAFSWQIREDIWGGVVDSEVRSGLAAKLIGDFQPILPPTERSMPKLMTFLAEIEAAAATAEWSNSAQQYERDGETAVRVNVLVSFCVQIRWICHVFKDLPGASVSIR